MSKLPEEISNGKLPATTKKSEQNSNDKSKIILLEPEYQEHLPDLEDPRDLVGSLYLDSKKDTVKFAFEESDN